MKQSNSRSQTVALNLEVKEWVGFTVQGDTALVVANFGCVDVNLYVPSSAQLCWDWDQWEFDRID